MGRSRKGIRSTDAEKTVVMNTAADRNTDVSVAKAMNMDAEKTVVMDAEKTAVTDAEKTVVVDAEVSAGKVTEEAHPAPGMIYMAGCGHADIICITVPEEVRDRARFLPFYQSGRA